MGSNQPVSFSPFSFFCFYACWSLCMWSSYIWLLHHLQTPSCTVTSYFLGKPLHSYSKIPLVALNSGSQPPSCSIMIFPFNQLPPPHPRSSAWSCPAVMFTFLCNCNLFFFGPTKITQCLCKIKYMYVQTNWPTNMEMLFSALALPYCQCEEPKIIHIAQNTYFWYYKCMSSNKVNYVSHGM